MIKFKWKKYIDNPKHLPPVETQLDKHISNMVQYYGIDYAKQWFKDMGFDNGLQ